MSTAAQRRAKAAWKRRNPAHEKEWSRTFSGRVSRMYTNIQCRCRTLMRGSPNHYGLPIIAREDFIELAHLSADYAQLWIDWVASDYNRALVPTVDRVDPKRGYLMDNMEFITAGDNSRRNNEITWRKRREQAC